MTPFLRIYRKDGVWSVELWEGEVAGSRSSAYDELKRASVGAFDAAEAIKRGMEWLGTAIGIPAECYVTCGRQVPCPDHGGDAPAAPAPRMLPGQVAGSPDCNYQVFHGRPGDEPCGVCFSCCCPF